MSSEALEEENGVNNTTMSDKESPHTIPGSEADSEGDVKQERKKKALTPSDLQVPLHLPIHPSYLENFPKLELTPYSIDNDKSAQNVLSLVHNAAKREICDLLGVVMPTLEILPHSDPSGELHPDVLDLKPWWDALIRFFFFVADTDDDIIRIATNPAVEITAHGGQMKIAQRLEKNRKSLRDRFAFAMEYIFRAADRAIDEYCETPTTDTLKRFVVKANSVVNFMLDSMHVATDIIDQINEVCNVNLPALQRKVVDSLCTFAKDRKGIFMCMCVRWMNDDELIRQWIRKYTGLKGRMYYDTWKEEFDEQRASFIQNLVQKYSS